MMSCAGNKWLKTPAMDYIAEREVEEQVDAVDGALECLGLAHQRFPLTEDVEDLVKGLKAYAPDVVINLCVDILYGFFDPRVRHS